MKKNLVAAAVIALIAGPALAETATVVVTPVGESEAKQTADVAVGGAAGAAMGALIAGPVGAVAGAALGGIAGSAEPAPEVQTFIVENPAPDVILEGDVVIGAGLPEIVVLNEIPGHEYSYVRVNGQDVLVNTDRQIVYVY